MRYSALSAAIGFAVLLSFSISTSLGCDPAQGSCSDAGDHKTTINKDSLLMFEWFTLTDDGCSTCGHESLQVLWTAPEGVTGKVQIEADGSCNGIAVMPYYVNIDASAGAANAEPPNMKNVCGDNAAEYWIVKVVNNSDKTLTNFSATLTCPTYKATSTNPVAPVLMGGRGSR